MDNWFLKCGVYTHTHTHTPSMNYYSAIKNNEIISSAAKWMELEAILLSGEMTQKQKAKNQTSLLTSRS